MNKRKIRDILRLSAALFFCWLYFPHLIAYSINRGGQKAINEDVKKMTARLEINLCIIFGLLYFLHNDSYFRALFYFRIGPAADLLISWYRPGDKYFCISKTLKLGEGCLISHPFSTILNADSIGKNFDVRHCTTLGATNKGRPSLGDNVSLGANVTIIGNVHIGNNVIVGAGSVVVKDVPDNCIVAGNPAKILRYLS